MLAKLFIKECYKGPGGAGMEIKTFMFSNIRKKQIGTCLIRQKLTQAFLSNPWNNCLFCLSHMPLPFTIERGNLRFVGSKGEMTFCAS